MNSIKNLFAKKPCLVMENSRVKLNFRCIPVNYDSAIIIGVHEVVSRKAQAKIWTVAVKTVEPDEVCTTHASWMTEIQFERAEAVLHVAELEHREILKGVLPYMKSSRNQAPRLI